ncbi:MAG TPA: histidine kinase, partial [Afipia sp.]|nr:histidine kinase [Afipia sp.]
MTRDKARRRTLWQIALLSAGFLVLVAISVISIVLVNKARDDSRWVVHTVEVENQISTVLLDIRRAESAARGYLLTSQPKFLAEHETAIQRILPGVDTLIRQISDSPVQIENSKQFREFIELRLAEFTKAVDFVKRNDIPGGVAMLRDGSGTAVQRITEIATAMRAEEDRLFQARTAAADRSQTLAAVVTTAGSG